jgi:hypothetical protein
VEAIREEPIRACGSHTGCEAIVEHLANLLPGICFFAIGITYTLIYETGTNLVIFDHNNLRFLNQHWRSHDKRFRATQAGVQLGVSIHAKVTIKVTTRGSVVGMSILKCIPAQATFLPFAKN